MTSNAFHERMYASGLSRWELADLLGIHSHELELAHRKVSLNGQPVRVVAELAARLDMHPGDLADVLEPVLGNHRDPDDVAPVEKAGAAAAAEADAVVVLTALATTSVPLTLDELATALTWPLERTGAVIDYAQAHPALAGPSALRRVPPHRWTLSTRLDPRPATQPGRDHPLPNAVERRRSHRAPHRLRRRQHPDYNTWHQVWGAS